MDVGKFRNKSILIVEPTWGSIIDAHIHMQLILYIWPNLIQNETRGGSIIVQEERSPRWILCLLPIFNNTVTGPIIYRYLNFQFN